MSEKSFVIQMIYGVIEAQINFETEHHGLIERRSWKMKLTSPKCGNDVCDCRTDSRPILQVEKTIWGKPDFIGNLLLVIFVLVLPVEESDNY